MKITITVVLNCHILPPRHSIAWNRKRVIFFVMQMCCFKPFCVCERNRIHKHSTCTPSHNTHNTAFTHTTEPKMNVEIIGLVWAKMSMDIRTACICMLISVTKQRCWKKLAMWVSVHIDTCHPFLNATPQNIQLIDGLFQPCRYVIKSASTPATTGALWHAPLEVHISSLEIIKQYYFPLSTTACLLEKCHMPFSPLNFSLHP